MKTQKNSSNPLTPRQIEIVPSEVKKTAELPVYTYSGTEFESNGNKIPLKNPKPTARKSPTPKPTARKSPTPKPTARKSPTPKPTARKSPIHEDISENDLKDYNKIKNIHIKKIIGSEYKSIYKKLGTEGKKFYNLKKEKNIFYKYDIYFNYYNNNVLLKKYAAYYKLKHYNYDREAAHDELKRLGKLYNGNLFLFRKRDKEHYDLYKKNPNEQISVYKNNFITLDVLYRQESEYNIISYLVFLNYLDNGKFQFRLAQYFPKNKSFTVYNINTISQNNNETNTKTLSDIKIPVEPNYNHLLFKVENDDRLTNFCYPAIEELLKNINNQSGGTRKNKKQSGGTRKSKKQVGGTRKYKKQSGGTKKRY
jgi:hypothetical protein